MAHSHARQGMSSLNAGPRAATLTLCLYLVAAGLLGGGGTPAPLAELALQLLAIVLFGGVLLVGSFASMRRASKPVRVIAAAVLLLPMLQLVPLPPRVWQALPGRELVQASLAVIGAEGSWQPVSVAPWATLASLLAMLPALAVLILAARLDDWERRQAVKAIVLTAGAGVVLGAAQLAGLEAAVLYPGGHQEYLTGFYANRNAMAVHLLAAILGSLMLASAPRAGHPSGWLLGVPLLVAALFLTGSRSGALLLMTIVAPVGGAMFFLVSSPRRTGARLAAMLAMLGGAVLAMLAAGRSGLAERFAGDPFARLSLWQDTLAATAHFWPVGSGLGTFRQAFLPFERLSEVDLSMPNRAHNDYLELALEAGVAGLVVLLLIIALAVHAWLRKWREGEPRHKLLFAAGTLLLMAVHSIIDYPLRTMSLSAMTALALAIVLSSPARGRAEAATSSAQRGQG